MRLLKREEGYIKPISAELFGIILLSIVTVPLLLFTAIAPRPLTFYGDKVIPAKVISEWRSQDLRVIKVEYIIKRPRYFFFLFVREERHTSNIDERFFSSFIPQIGDCIKVWVPVFDKGIEGELYNDRNIFPCNN